MADRLTQIQDLVNMLSGHFRDSIGMLHVEHEKLASQSSALSGTGAAGVGAPAPAPAPATTPGGASGAPAAGAGAGGGVAADGAGAAGSSAATISQHVETYAQLIGKTARDLDRSLGFLPNIRAAEDAQLDAIETLEQDSRQASQRFRATVDEAEATLHRIRAALQVITTMHYELGTGQDAATGSAAEGGSSAGGDVGGEGESGTPQATLAAEQQGVDPAATMKVEPDGDASASAGAEAEPAGTGAEAEPEPEAEPAAGSNNEGEEADKPAPPPPAATVATRGGRSTRAKRKQRDEGDLAKQDSASTDSPAEAPSEESAPNTRRKRRRAVKKQ